MWQFPCGRGRGKGRGKHKGKGDKDKVNQKERKVENPNAKETVNLEKARVPSEILVLSAGAMIIGAVSAREK